MTNFKGKKHLLLDIKRGVKLIKDYNYKGYYESTRSSLEFFHNTKEIIQYLEVEKAQLEYTRKHNYRLRIFTKSGHVFVFTGCSFGYTGEGSRGSKEILQELGFKPKQYNKVFEHRDHMTKDDKMTLRKTA